MTKPRKRKKTTTESAHPRIGRPRTTGAVVATAVLVILAGCASTPERAEAPLRSTPTTTSPAAASSTVPATVEATAVDLISSALTGAGGGYDFDAAIVVDGERVGAFSGRYRPGAAELTVSVGETDVRYVLTDDGRWLNEGGEWIPLADDAPLTDPLAGLDEPLEATVVSSEPGVIVARYRGTALGIDVDEVAVRLTLSDGRIVELSYQQPLGDRIAEVTTTLTYGLAGPPITAPLP